MSGFIAGAAAGALLAPAGAALTGAAVGAMVGGGVGGSVAAQKAGSQQARASEQAAGVQAKLRFARLRYKLNQRVKPPKSNDRLPNSKLLKQSARLVNKENFYSLFKRQVLTRLRVFRQVFHRAVNMFALLQWSSFKPILAMRFDSKKVKRRLSVRLRPVAV